jgi:ABC-2 type transport system ATP-binding protein
MIELHDASKRFRKNEVLKDISLSVPAGRIIGIAGENGSGKSTLIKLMAGLLQPTAGEVHLDGEHMPKRSAEAIAYLPDADVFHPEFTTGQLFSFYATQFGDFSHAKAREAADFLGVDLKVRLKEMSKGSRGRAKMAVTLGRDTPYLMMDEPFTGFDPMVRQDMIRGLIRFTDPETQSIILSTHEIREVAPLLDELVVLKAGRIVGHEEVEDIRDHHGKDAAAWMMALYREGESDGKRSNG